MKKNLFHLATVICLATTLSAQQSMATLNHNDSITVFYGSNALIDAHVAAENGDIITLSAGTFLAVAEISKAVTIRGAGMFADSIANTDPTIITGNIVLNIPEDPLNHLTLEGIRFINNIYYTEVYRPHFIKCKIQSISETYSIAMQEAVFINCIIHGWCNMIRNSEWVATNTTFLNSVILGTTNYQYDGSPELYQNCILKLSYNQVQNKQLYNCIVYSEGNYPGVNNNSYNSYNCVGIATRWGEDWNYFYTLEGYGNHQNYNMTWGGVFVSFRGTYAEGESFELQDSIATTILGNDGTQVGIYGGLYPFDPRVSNPQIRRINVANRSTADGKLSVDIEVVNE